MLKHFQNGRFSFTEISALVLAWQTKQQALTEPDANKQIVIHDISVLKTTLKDLTEEI